MGSGPKTGVAKSRVHNLEGNKTDHEPHLADYLYGIPYAALLPEELENIAAAGRCISATHEAAGSFRVMPTCMGIGQAAGVAAALARRADSRLGGRIAGVLPVQCVKEERAETKLRG